MKKNYNNLITLNSKELDFLECTLEHTPSCWAAIEVQSMIDPITDSVDLNLLSNETADWLEKVRDRLGC